MSAVTLAATLNPFYCVIRYVIHVAKSFIATEAENVTVAYLTQRERVVGGGGRVLLQCLHLVY